MQIDHVIYGTADLDAAEAWFATTAGLTAVPGGAHDGLGTHNRIVPLGDGSYIELLAVADPEMASRSPIGAAVQAGIAKGDGFLGWALAIPDVSAVCERTGASVSTVGRQGMTARLVGLSESLSNPGLPFFIERPPRSSPAEAISWLEVACDSARLEAWLGPHTLPVRLVEGEPGLRAVGLGDRELRPSTRPRSPGG
jgi:catechol 2,3-dioxygenase-like lactoylglutathione lyase family enzyme